LIDFSSLAEAVNPAYLWSIKDYKRYNVFYGGAASGKSVFVAQRAVYRMLTERGHNYMVVRKSEKANRFSSFALMKQVIAGWGLKPYFHIKESTMEIMSLTNGNHMVFRGLDDIEKLKSFTFETGVLTDIWIEEASEITKEEDWQLRLRLRGMASVPKQIVYTFNPISALHWLKTRFFDNPISEEYCTVIRTTYKDNRWLPYEDAEQIEGLKDEDEEFYKIYALGEWGSLGNHILTSWQVRAFNVKEFLPLADKVYFGVDFGFNNPSACLLIAEYDKEVYICDEVYMTRLTNGQFIDQIKSAFPDDWHKHYHYPDSAEPDRIQEMQNAGMMTFPVIKNVKDGLDELRRRKIHVHPSCTNTIMELKTYSYKKNANGDSTDKPVEFMNHAMDALRYGVYTSKNSEAIQLFV